MDNMTASQLFNSFMAFRRSVDEYIRNECSYIETYNDVYGREQKRRPVMVADTPEMRRKIKRMLNEWDKRATELHELEPARFPLSSTLFNPKPVIVSGVKGCQIYKTNAATSRLVTGEKMATRTKATLRKMITKSDEYAEIITRLKSELDYWNENSDQLFRIRCDSYNDIQCLISFPDNPPEKVRVNESGLILFPAKGWDEGIKVSSPEEKPQKRKVPPRNLFKNLNTIPTSLPIDGKIYLESDVDKARGKRISKREGDLDQLDIRIRKKSGKSFLL